MNKSPKKAKAWLEANRVELQPPDHPSPELAEQVAKHDRDLAVLGGRVEAHSEKLRKDQVETAAEQGLPRDLVSAEQNALLRHSPLRLRWPEVGAFDERVAALEMRRAAIAAELRDLREQAQAAPAAAAGRLAEWELGDRTGPRPEATQPRLESDTKRLQGELDGIDRAVTRVLAENRDYVDKHRRRLTHEADDHTAAKHERYLAAIAELEAAREDLAAARRASVWARLFPSEHANQLPADSLAGGRKRALVPLGVNAPVATSHLFVALRLDARWLPEMCTPTQRLVMQGRDPRQPPQTEWVDTPEAKARRAQRMAEWATSR